MILENDLGFVEDCTLEEGAASMRAIELVPDNFGIQDRAKVLEVA